jgi:hypothetical protein
MGRGFRRGVAFGWVLLAAGLGLAQEDLAARVKKAQEAARANGASPRGQEWTQRNSGAIDRLMVPLLNRCLPDPPGDIPTVFSVYVRLSPAGRAHEVVTELDATLSRCMTAAAREMKFPPAPGEDYWIQVNMAAPL